MSTIDITIFNREQFEKNLNADKERFKLDGNVISHKNPVTGEMEPIAHYENGKITSNISLGEKDEVFKQLQQMDHKPARMNFDGEGKRTFEDLFKPPNQNYAFDGKKVTSAKSGKELCEYEDGKFILTQPDDATLQELADMLHEGKVDRVTVIPADSPVGKRLTEKLLDKGITVNNLVPDANRVAAANPPGPPPASRQNSWASNASTAVDEDLAPTETSSERFDSALREISENESTYHQKKGRDFSSKFQSYNDPNDLRSNAPFKMYRTGHFSRSYTGKEANGVFSALVNDYFRRKRQERGAAFEVDRDTLAVTALSEKRSAIKGMVKFAAAAKTDPKEKLKFVAKSEKAAKKFAQEAMKQGIPLDQVQIDIVDSRGKTVQRDFKLSLLNEILTRDYMRMRTATKGGLGNRSYSEKGKYSEQLNDLNIKPFLRKKDPDLIKAGQVRQGSDVVSRFDLNNPKSVMTQPHVSPAMSQQRQQTPQRQQNFAAPQKKAFPPRTM
jgi:hypothetical protein